MGGGHFLRLPGLLPAAQVHLKLEGLNPAGSIKLRTAAAMVEDAETAGWLAPGAHIIESSSGNLAIALAIIAATGGYRLTCVVDPNISTTSLRIVEAFGAEVVRVDRADPRGGYLGARLRAVREYLQASPSTVWLNQYVNPANPAAHAAGTAAEILDEFPVVDYLFVGVGTAGTLMGCVDRFRARSPRTRIVAVDAVGSVTFGGPQAPRRLPGLGASIKPALFSGEGLHRQVQISESDAIATCRMLARRYGYLAGGSTGSVLAAVLAMADTIEPGSLVVAISPDGGERYIDTIYSDEWVRSHYGADALDRPPLPGGGRDAARSLARMSSGPGGE